jgi:hypothetical protein
MPQEFWYPISTATHDLPAGYDDFTNGGGANKNASTRPGGGRTGPMTHDDGATYLHFNNTAQQSLNPDWPAPIVSIVTFTAGMRGFGTNLVVSSFQFSDAAGTFAAALYSTLTYNGATWQTDGPNDISAGGIYRPGGGTWVASDFANDMTLFPTINDGGAGDRYITSTWGELNYLAPDGGFVFLLGLAGLLSLQMVGPMTDYTQFEKFLQWRHDVHPRHTILTGDEKVQAWDEYKSYRAPRFFYG